MENQIAYYTKERRIRYLKLRVSPVVAAYLTKGLFSLRFRWMCKYGCIIRIVKNPTTGIIETRYFNKADQELF